jgi:UDP-N-acetylglucosamine pyrophosphorylase
VLKLNGGLGTGMGLDFAKSLLKVKGNDTFLDLTAKQVISMRKAYKQVIMGGICTDMHNAKLRNGSRRMHYTSANIAACPRLTWPNNNGGSYNSYRRRALCYDLIRHRCNCLYQNVRFALMNSFSTSDDTMAFLQKYPDIVSDPDLEFVQNKVGCQTLLARPCYGNS